MYSACISNDKIAHLKLTTGGVAPFYKAQSRLSGLAHVLRDEDLLLTKGADERGAIQRLREVGEDERPRLSPFSRL